MATVQDIPNHKVLLITGACGGIGKEMVKYFSKHRYHVISVTHNDSDFACDLSYPLQISYLWEKLSKQGIEVNCLINNAGIYKALSYSDYTQAQIHEVLNVNLVGAFNMSFHFANQVKQNGSIINISSIAGIAGGGDPIYSASKAGLIGLTKSLAQSLAPRIRVNAIAPAVVRTPMMDIIP